MKERSRLLRKNQTDAEKKLWNILRSKRFHGFKFRRQCCLSYYILDFVCFEKKLIVELDGDYHLDFTQAEYDVVRDNYLRGAGFKVLRFWNNEILKEIDGALKIIYENLEGISGS